MNAKRLAISFQLWVVVVCLLGLSGRNTAKAQDEMPPIVAYAVEIGDINLGSQAYNYNLYAMNTETNEIVFEAHTQDHDCPITLSLNHQWLLYAEISPEYGSATTTYAVDLQTGERIALGDVHSPQWSSDSQRLIYSEFYDSGQNVYIFDAQSRDTEVVDFIMTFSRLDFEWIGEAWVYAQRVGDNVIDVGGGRQTTQRLDNNITYFALSPDAQWVAIVLGERVDRYLFILDTATGAIEQIDNTPIGAATPLWSSDGRWLIYITRDGIKLWDALQGTLRQLTTSDGFSESNFTLSPNNHYLAYREYLPGGTENSQFGIQIVDIETGETQFVRRRIDTFAGELSWVSNTQLAYTYADSEISPNERIHDVYVYDATTGESVNLTNSAEREWFECALG